MKRIDAIKDIVEVAEDELIVSNIGYPSRELFAIKDRKENFYMMGSMGLASSIGLGVALNTKRKIWVIDGDGSVLMNLGTLSTISNYGSNNFILIILDDSSYGSTGCQPTHTSFKTNLSHIARGAGLESVYDIDSQELKKTLFSLKNKKGPHVLVVKIESGNSSASEINLTAVQIKKRFMELLKC